MERTPSPVVLGLLANHWLDLDLMSTLKLYGMRSTYDEVMASGIKRQHEPPRIVGDLLQPEIAERQARSIKYQMTIAKLRWRKTSTTSISPAHRSMWAWFASLQAAPL